MTIALIISIVLTFLMFFITGSEASLVMSWVILLAGFAFSFIFKDFKTRVVGLKLFYITFSFYGLFALFHYLGYYYDYGNFTIESRDEYKFFQVAEAYANTPLPQIFYDCFIRRVHIENEGYIFYIAGISSLATTYFDGNHLFLQFLGTMLIGSLCSFLLLRLFLAFFELKSAYNNSLIFLLCSVFSVLSVVLWRDIFISFFYLWGFVIIFQKFSIKGLIGLIILTLLTWEFRFENGLFFLIFIFYYLYVTFKKYKLLFIVASVLVLIVSSPFIIGNYMKASASLDRYTSFTEDNVTSVEDSFAKHIWALPSPIKELGILLNSQLQPFPSWTALSNANNIYSQLESLLPIVYAFFWFVIIFSLMKWLVVEGKYKLLPRDMAIFGVIILVFLVANVANITFRRIAGVYPVIYLIYLLLVKHHVTTRNKRNTTFLAVFCYLFILTAYLFLKNA